MPTREQMAAVTTRIEWLQSMRYLIEDGVVSGPVSDAAQRAWEDLDRAQQQTVLDENVDWEGFTQAEKLDVERRVIADEEAPFWMDGVRTYANPTERAESEVGAIKARQNNRTIGPTTDLGLGEDWLVIGPVDLGNWQEWNEAQRLAVLQEMVSWEGVDDAARRHMLEREVDFSRVAPQDQRAILGEVWHENDSEPVGRHAVDGQESGVSDLTIPSIRPLTRQLIDCCHFDTWPGHAAVIDFGIDSDRHLGALQHAIRQGLVTPEELDAAMGNGEKLTAIAQRGDNPYRDVTFHTSWDGMRLDREMPSGGQSYDQLRRQVAEQGKYRDRDHELDLGL